MLPNFHTPKLSLLNTLPPHPLTQFLLLMFIQAVFTCIHSLFLSPFLQHKHTVLGDFTYTDTDIIIFISISISIILSTGIHVQITEWSSLVNWDIRFGVFSPRKTLQLMLTVTKKQKIYNHQTTTPDNVSQGCQHREEKISPDLMFQLWVQFAMLFQW